MKNSLKALIKATSVLAPQTLSATANTTGVNVADFGSLAFLVQAGAMAFDGSNKLALVMQHSDVDVDGSYANCTADDIFDAEDGANGIAKNLDSTDDQNNAHMVHYRGYKKFARLRIVETGTVSVPLSVTALRGHPEMQPPL